MKNEHRAARGSRARRRPSSWIILCSCGVLSAAALAACANERPAASPTPAPGAPAYWESNLPADPGSMPERLPAPGTTPINPEGTTDKFLWDQGATPPQGPDSQAALKDPNDEKAIAGDLSSRLDGGAEGGLDAGPP